MFIEIDKRNRPQIITNSIFIGPEISGSKKSETLKRTNGEVALALRVVADSPQLIELDRRNEFRIREGNMS